MWMGVWVHLPFYVFNGGRKGKSGGTLTMKLSTPLHWKAGQTMLIHWIWEAGWSSPDFYALVCFVILRETLCPVWINARGVSQSWHLHQLMWLRQGLLLCWVVWSNVSDRSLSYNPREQTSLAIFYFLLSNLITLCQRWLEIQCCWCGCTDLFGIKLVLYIHIYHQWFHTEEYNGIFVANLYGLL